MTKHPFLLYENMMIIQYRRLCNENTTAKIMQTFRMIVIMAKNNGWIYTDSFMNYKIRLKLLNCRRSFFFISLPFLNLAL